MNEQMNAKFILKCDHCDDYQGYQVIKYKRQNSERILDRLPQPLIHSTGMTIELILCINTEWIAKGKGLLLGYGDIMQYQSSKD